VAWWMWLASLIGVALLGSLAVAVQRPGRGRTVTSWLGAVAFYVVLVGMFGSWVHGALARGAKGPLVGLGFLLAIFSLGLLVALYKTFAAARGRGPGESGATH